MLLVGGGILASLLIALLLIYLISPETLGRGVVSVYKGVSEGEPLLMEEDVSQALDASGITTEEMGYILDQITPDLVIESLEQLPEGIIYRDEALALFSGKVDLGTVSPEALQLFAESTFPVAFEIPEEFQDTRRLRPIITIFLDPFKSDLLALVEELESEQGKGATAEGSEERWGELVAESTESAESALSAQGKAGQDNSPGTNGSEREPMPVVDVSRIKEMLPKEQLLQLLHSPSDEMVLTFLHDLGDLASMDFVQFDQAVQDLFPFIPKDVTYALYGTMLELENQGLGIGALSETLNTLPLDQQLSGITFFRFMLEKYVRENYDNPDFLKFQMDELAP